jgi:hypothetical protein
VIDGPRTYDFADPADRDLALYHLSNRGREWVIPLVAQIADQLAEPVALRCALMAAAIGKTGSGKLALRRVLMAFLAEVDAANRAFPAPTDPPPPGAWWDDPYFEKADAIGKARFALIMAARVKFAAILNGDPPPVAAPEPKPAIVIQFPMAKEPPGPRWRARTAG